MRQGPLRLALLALSIAGPELRAQCQPSIQRLINERRLDEALTQASAATARNPRDDAALECLGVVQFRRGRFRDAIVQLEKAVQIDDKVASHHLWLGNALGNVADSTSKLKLPFLARRVKAEFEKTVALDPASVDGRDGLVSFYSQAPGVMGGSMEKAREQVREMIRLNPMRGHIRAARLYLQEKKPAEAERELLAAEQAAPDSTAAGYQLAAFYQNAERWSDAFGVYDRMQKRFPDEVLVRFQIGRTAALSGQQLERGERELKQIIAAPPADFPRATLAGAHHRLGMIYERQGRKDIARTEYQQALTIDPKNEGAKKSLAALK
ncbi:MAG TPA: tetratricopeptide repeat protein [Gemmatimonadaceae bacterium]|nr:tetratricopeptide repeat protein [Gemmatimonadaceae bacterium]